MHRGPRALHGCKIMIWGDKTRGPTYDHDTCYVRILYAPTLVESLAESQDDGLKMFEGCSVLRGYVALGFLWIRRAKARDWGAGHQASDGNVMDMERTADRLPFLHFCWSG